MLNCYGQDVIKYVKKVVDYVSLVIVDIHGCFGGWGEGCVYVVDEPIDDGDDVFAV